VRRHTEAGTPQSLPGKLAINEPVTGTPADAEPPTVWSPVDEGDEGAASCGCGLWSAGRSGVRRLREKMGSATQTAGRKAGAAVKEAGKTSVQSAHNTAKRAAAAVRKFAKAITARSSRRTAAGNAACQCAFCT